MKFPDIYRLDVIKDSAVRTLDDPESTPDEIASALEFADLVKQASAEKGTDIIETQF